uniref:FIIND domain-containing protein n=1 Tax=Anabas testudineus TaxID=64144 RepID=A0A3Q1KAB1_ANATE
MEEKLRPQSGSLSTSSSDLHDEPGPSKRPVNLFPTHISQRRSSTYRPAPGELSQTQCEQLASALRRITFTLEELDLSRNSVKKSGAKLLFAALKSSNCKVRTLRLSDCILSERCLDSLVSVRKSYHLMELDLSGNKYLRDSGVKLLSDGLRNRYCRLRTLRLSSCNLSENSCGYLASAIKSRPDCVEELDLSLNNLQDSGIKLLSDGLKSPYCELKTLRLNSCNLSENSCGFLASAIKSNPYCVEELDLSLNKLQDSGIKLLSDGLKSQYCKLKTLRLVNCLISDEGCAALVSALQSKPSDLTELDLSGNELQDQGMNLLFALVESPDCKLKMLRVEEGRNLITLDRTKSSHSATQPAQRQTSIFTTPDELLEEQRQLKETTGSRSEHRVRRRKALHDTMADFTKKRHTAPFTTPDELLELRQLEETLRLQQPPLPGKPAPLPREQLPKQQQGNEQLEEFEQQRRRRAPLTTLLEEQQQFKENRTEQTSQESLIAASSDDSHLSLDLSTTNTESGSSVENTEVMEKPHTVHDPSHFIPEILINTFGETSYRFRVEYPGTYQCTLTRLVFTMCREGELLYRIVQWDESLLQSAGKTPAGPLFDIQCSEDSVFQLHIPHCETKPASLSDGLSVAHISDDGMRILDPLQITDTHVVVDVPHLSAFGLVWDIMNRILNQPMRCQVLLFHRPRENRKLNVFLLPENIPLQEVRQQQEGAEYIEAPSSCHLIKGHTYSLHSPENYRVQPLRAQFDFNYGPNYHPTFEIRPNSNAEEVTVMVRDQEETPVWEYNARLNAPGACGQDPPRRQRLQEEDEGRLFHVRAEFIQRASDSVLDDLLDNLLEEGVINHREMETVQRMLNRAHRARELIDMVLRRGNPASQIMINNLRVLDPFLFQMLRLG